MSHRAHAPVQRLIQELVRRHGISADVALDMLERAARRRSVSVHDLALRISGSPAPERSDQAA